MNELWAYLKTLFGLHRATRNALIEQGKTYRSHKVAFENGYTTAILDIQDYLRMEFWKITINQIEKPNSTKR